MSKKLSKLFTLMLVCAFTLCSTITVSAAKQPETTVSKFNLIEYLKKNPVSTREEFLYIIENGNSNNIASFSVPYISSSTESNELFSYVIDEENQLVYTKTLQYGEESIVQSARASKTIYQNTGTVQHETYSDIGLHLFTVTTEGTFQYDKSSYCECIASHGFFNPAFLGLYDSSPWISNGNYSATKAYVDTYGTANLDFTISKTLGLEINLHSANYSLELTCNYMGEFEGFYSQDVIN